MIHKERKIITEHTVRACTSCEETTTKKYVAGDMLFEISEKCASCKQNMRIEKIYCQTITY